MMDLIWTMKGTNYSLWKTGMLGDDLEVYTGSMLTLLEIESESAGIVFVE